MVKLDGRYVTLAGRPVTTDNHADIPHWEFVETQMYEVDLKDLAPGVHHLEIRRGVAGSSLPLVNEHDIWFGRPRRSGQDVLPMTSPVSMP